MICSGLRNRITDEAFQIIIHGVLFCDVLYKYNLYIPWVDRLKMLKCTIFVSKTHILYIYIWKIERPESAYRRRVGRSFGQG